MLVDLGAMSLEESEVAQPDVRSGAESGSAEALTSDWTEGTEGTDDSQGMQLPSTARNIGCKLDM